MPTHQDLPVILHNDKRGLLTIEDGKLDVLQLSKDGRPPKRLLTCSLRNFLRARLASAAYEGQRRRLDLFALIQKGHELRLSTMRVLIEPTDVPEAEEWIQTAMQAAYGQTKPFRRALVLVNPVGGKGKAKSLVREHVLPILEAAGTVVELTETTHKLHAEEIARDMDLSYDVIVTCSGDGLVYEVINGLAARKDARKALKVPIAPIPTGSANAICINLFGVKDTFNIPLATLNIIKGQPLPIDLCSVLLLPSRERRYSFISQALGLMVDLDIGTEHVRWMGDTRFVYGFLRGVITNKNFKCRVKMKVIESDKVEMARKARAEARQIMQSTEGKALGGGQGSLIEGMRTLEVNGAASNGDGLIAEGGPSTADGNDRSDDTPDEGPLPEVKELQPDDSWVTIESGTKKAVVKKRRGSKASTDEAAVPGAWQDGEGILYVYAGLRPWVARDLMQWPVAMNGDGAVDIVIQSITPRGTMVSAITGAEKGEAYWMECQHYYKASAFIAENLDKKGQPLVAIDGEPFPFDSFHVEVHSGLATVLSLDGHFFISDFLRKQNIHE
ncbi:ATP-NAD kinase-like domain-containing protein [Naematelia encephala]|uniref:ATP-NAD kinase-like domain-containing protein n=1 Tax=Naematelia encephala TaxID=71784 RepID=A0A1Y2B158_9TREE|nr:ATP-NAD kinase-like domain-containing protein [Naematelia encephala]